MRLVRNPEVGTELNTEEQIRREVEEKASQKLLENDRPNSDVRVVQDIKNYFFPKTEIK